MIAILVAAHIAAQKSAEFEIFGVGNLSCAAWQAGSTELNLGRTWILGYFTGRSYAERIPVGADTDADGIFGEVELVCRDSPSLPLVEAANRAYVKIKRRSSGPSH